MYDEINESTQAEAVPQTLEEAMRAMRAGNQSEPASTVGMAGVDEGAGAEGSQDTSTQSSQASVQGTVDSGATQQPEDSYSDAGGYSNGSQESSRLPQLKSLESQEEAFDYVDIGRSYIKSAQQLAVQSANQLFRQQNIRKASINDLYQKDEDGRVSFTNPDDPNRPFSNRTEAQQWCDAFNAQIDSEWRNTVQQYQNQYAKDIQPTLRVLSFAPQYDAMSAKEQKVFDQVVEEYAIKDSSGMTVGYSCDLGAAKRMAQNICRSMSDSEPAAQQTQQQQQRIQGGGPAVDAKTSGSGNPQNDNQQPKNLSEAMKMVMQQKKGNK